MLVSRLQRAVAVGDGADAFVPPGLIMEAAVRGGTVLTTTTSVVLATTGVFGGTDVKVRVGVGFVYTSVGMSADQQHTPRYGTRTLWRK